MSGIDRLVESHATARLVPYDSRTGTSPGKGLSLEPSLAVSDRHELCHVLAW